MKILKKYINIFKFNFYYKNIRNALKLQNKKI